MQSAMRRLCGVHCVRFGFSSSKPQNARPAPAETPHTYLQLIATQHRINTTQQTHLPLLFSAFFFTQIRSFSFPKIQASNSHHSAFPHHHPIVQYMLLQHHSHSLHRPTSCARRNAANSSSARRSSSTHASAGASASSTAAAAATASSTAARASHRPMSSPGASPSEQTVSFLNTHGNQLVGTLTTSTSAADRCVILCHGYASFRDGFHLPAIAAALAEAGYNSLRCVFGFCKAPT